MVRQSMSKVPGNNPPVGLEGAGSADINVSTITIPNEIDSERNWTDGYFDRLIKYTPIEMIALYFCLISNVMTWETNWSIVSKDIIMVGIFIGCQIGIPIYLGYLQVSSRLQIVISSLSFFFWATAYEGPFRSDDFDTFSASICLPIFTFLAPNIIANPRSKKRPPLKKRASVLVAMNGFLDPENFRSTNAMLRSVGSSMRKIDVGGSLKKIDFGKSLQKLDGSMRNMFSVKPERGSSEIDPEDPTKVEFDEGDNMLANEDTQLLSVGGLDERTPSYTEEIMPQDSSEDEGGLDERTLLYTEESVPQDSSEGEEEHIGGYTERLSFR